jgi:hypothetical protein
MIGLISRSIMYACRIESERIFSIPVTPHKDVCYGASCRSSPIRCSHCLGPSSTTHQSASSLKDSLGFLTEHLIGFTLVVHQNAMIITTNEIQRIPGNITAHEAYHYFKRESIQIYDPNRSSPFIFMQREIQKKTSNLQHEIR